MGPSEINGHHYSPFPRVSRFELVEVRPYPGFQHAQRFPVASGLPIWYVPGSVSRGSSLQGLIRFHFLALGILLSLWAAMSFALDEEEKLTRAGNCIGVISQLAPGHFNAEARREASHFRLNYLDVKNREPDAPLLLTNAAKTVSREDKEEVASRIAQIENDLEADKKTIVEGRLWTDPEKIKDTLNTLRKNSLDYSKVLTARANPWVERVPDTSFAARYTAGMCHFLLPIQTKTINPWDYLGNVYTDPESTGEWAIYSENYPILQSVLEETWFKSGGSFPLSVLLPQKKKERETFLRAYTKRIRDRLFSKSEEKDPLVWVQTDVITYLKKDKTPRLLVFLRSSPDQPTQDPIEKFTGRMRELWERSLSPAPQVLLIPIYNK
jgi:uncharacterized protein YlzI (FlbEa/FlbD family)